MTFPIMIVEDRYQGVYSGYRWLAFPNFDSYYSYQRDIEQGVWGDDVSAATWAQNNQNKYWGGATPSEALEALQMAHRQEAPKTTPLRASDIDASNASLGPIRYDDLAI